MPDGLYDADILVWSERQAELLRRLAAGERVNDAVDWENLIDEVESVGRSELRACESLLRQALRHMLKAHAWPDSRSISHWREEIGIFLDDARGAYTPSMQQRIDLGALFAGAVRRVRTATDESGLPRPVQGACPYTLPELLAPEPDVLALIAKLDSGKAGARA